ncbi:MAG: hypothetical protein ACLFWB_11860 [Armatimonadota bacterium]
MHAGTAQTEDLGDGYKDHGVGAPVSTSRGIVATVDGDGTPVALVWLYDHRHGYALLMIDATTGETQQFQTPWDGDWYGPFSSMLASNNCYYTHFGSHFVEFDPTKPGFTFWEETQPRMAMGMTESDDGLIYAVTYPDSGVVQYNPATREMTDFGHVYDQNWAMYQRDVACDDTGWLYFGIGNTKAQIVAFNPETAEAIPMFAEDARPHGRGRLYRDKDGRVYGNLQRGDWYRFYEGEKTHIGPELDERNSKQIITGAQGLFHREFPGGGRVETLDLLDRKMVVTTAGGEKAEFDFDYHSEGPRLTGVATAPNGTICGGTAHPMRFFQFDPESDEWTRRDAYGQWNTLAAAERLFYIGGYGGGFLLEWDPFREWVPTEKGNPDSNPRFLYEITPTVHRPHGLLVHPNGTHVVLGGSPGYGLTGGGLLIWNRQEETATVLKHTDLLTFHSTGPLVALPDSTVLGGSMCRPGSGGERKAESAELYVLDLDDMQMTWHDEAIERTDAYTGLVLTQNGLVFGIADRSTLFAFDPETREIVHEQDFTESFGNTVGQQGPRPFVEDNEGGIYILFTEGIARLNPETYEVSMRSEAPMGITGGGDYLDGRIYFFQGSHVYSWEVSGGR